MMTGKYNIVLEPLHIHTVNTLLMYYVSIYFYHLSNGSNFDVKFQMIIQGLK